MATADDPTSKGHLNPGDQEVSFDRFVLGPGLEHLVRHVWLVRWDIRQGEVRRQRVLTYPTFNAVFTPASADLYGPEPRLSERELHGNSWAVGILFRPATGRLLTATPAIELVGCSEPLGDSPRAKIVHAMSSAESRTQLVSTLRAWLLPVADRLDESGLLVNEACRIAEEDSEVLRANELADRTNTSPRTLERLVKRHIGVTPKWLIECRRLQEAATTLFAEPKTDLNELAMTLGYADYSHFSRRYKQILGETPDETRRKVAS